MSEYIIDSQTISDSKKLNLEFTKLEKLSKKIKDSFEMIEKSTQNIKKLTEKINDSPFVALRDFTESIKNNAGSFEESIINMNESIRLIKDLPNNINSIKDGFKNASEGFGDYDENNLEQFGINLWNIKNKVDEFKKAFDLAQDGIIDSARETNKFGAVLGNIPLSLQAVTTAYSMEKDGMHGFAKLISPLGVALADLTTKFAPLITTLQTLALPFTVVVSAIVAFSTALSYLINTNDEFRTKVTEVWSSIQATFQNAYDNIINPILGGISLLFTNVMENGIMPLWNVWVDFVRIIAEIFLDLWSFLSPYINELLNKFGPVLTDVFNGLGYVISVAVNLVINCFTSLGIIIKNIVKGIIDVFKGFIIFFTGEFTDDTSKVVEGAFKIFKGLYDAVANTFSGIWSAILGIFSKGGALFDGMSESIGNFFRTVVNGIIGGMNDLIKDPFNKINGLLNSIRGFNVLGFGKIFFNLWPYNPLKVPQIPYLYHGGFVNPGQLFVANEPGNPELIGNIGGRTAVVNNKMILQGIEQAMRNAVVDGMKLAGHSDTYVDLYVDGVFSERKLVKTNEKALFRTGKAVFVAG